MPKNTTIHSAATEIHWNVPHYFEMLLCTGSV